MTTSHARSFVSRIQARLRHAARMRTHFEDAVPELFNVSVGRSTQLRPRFNILVPTVQPEKIYGGVSTALRVAASLREALGPCDLRFLITSDRVDRHGLAELARRFEAGVAIADPQDDAEGMTVVPISTRRYLPLSLRASDRFLATAWWTADLGFRLRKAQKELFGEAPRLIYLIQDYEPGFYCWSNQYALSMATYDHPDETIALINSEELANFMAERRSFPHAFCIPYGLEPRLAGQLTATEKERIILVYGRPSVQRNTFGIILEGLRRWQSLNPRGNSVWRIVMAGEDFDPQLLSGLENASVVGKLSLDRYAELLNRAGVGISMMMSPHPSYPPLEMASGGLVTLTNAFENKDLSQRAKTIISLVRLSPDAIVEGLVQATGRVQTDGLTQPVTLASLPSPYPVVDYSRIVALQTY